MLKLKAQLAQLAENSENMFFDNIFDQYARRHQGYEGLCLAEFATTLSDKQIKNSIVYSDTRRKKDKILKYRGYNMDKDNANHHREMILLYHPWRNEEAEVESVNAEEVYYENRHKINEKYAHFHRVKNLMEAMNEAEEAARPVQREEIQEFNKEYFDDEDYNEIFGEANEQDP